MELKDALLLLYVIMVSSFLEPLFSCDLQRLFTESIVAKHILGIISTFFLITLTNEDEIRSLPEMFKTTGIIYGMYILSIKSKARFALLMLGTLTADQILRVQVGIINKRDTEKIARDGDLALKNKLIKVRAALTWVIVALIVGGMLHYYIRARLEFGDQFSTVAFFAGTKKCAHGPA
jgi:hypothetical protein